VEATLDSAVQQRLDNFSLSAQIGLATLLLDVERPAEAMQALEGLEEKHTLSSDTSAALWTLRIRALEAQDRIEEATRLFESIAQRSPDAPGLPGAAGVLARALDRSATELFESDPQSEAAEDLWRKAAFYYWLSVKRALEGSAALNPEDVSEVAQRLYVIALFFNDVPEGQQTFVDWQGPILDPELWEDAARIYERLDKQAPSYRVSIERARTLAILGRISEAEGIYARLFDQNSIVAPGGQGFDRKVIEARPELVSAYLEWGVAAHLVGREQNDSARLDRAGEIYGRIIESSTPSVRTWWQAKYFQIKLLSDRGDYEMADTAIRSVKRTTDVRFDKGEFGFEQKLAALESELAKKVFDKKPK
jgi:tetratricopeptide (TPR) repeat protein